LKLKRIEKDLDKLQAMYDLGISDCKRHLEDLKKYIER
jgi:predicted patatin/cPLA2 family phospholipase